MDETYKIIGEQIIKENKSNQEITALLMLLFHLWAACQLWDKDEDDNIMFLWLQLNDKW